MYPQSTQYRNNNGHHTQLLGYGDPTLQQNGNGGGTCVGPTTTPGVSPAELAKCYESRNLPLSPNPRSRGMVDRAICLLPDKYKKPLASGHARFQDYAFYSQKAAGADTTIDMFTAGQPQTPGVTNLNQGRLNGDQLFIVWGIQLQSVVAVNSGSFSLPHASWGQIQRDVLAAADAGTSYERTTLDSAIINGENQFRINNTAVWENMPNGRFATMGDPESGNIPNLWVLDSAIVLLPDAIPRFQLDLPVACTANTAIRLDLHGQLAIIAPETTGN